MASNEANKIISIRYPIPLLSDRSITSPQTHTTHTAITSSSPHIKSHLKIQSFRDFQSHSKPKKTSRRRKEVNMAAITSAAVTIPSSFTGLKAGGSSSKAATAVVAARAVPKFAVKASLKDFGVGIAATAASAMLASNALAVEVKLGGDDGSLLFLPGTFEVASGEKITFINNAGFPHNVVFDEDQVPTGVDVSKISMNEEDLLNSKGETYTVSLTEKGTYTFYCAPHQGAGMVGKVTVK